MPATVYCHGVPSGMTLSATLFPNGSDTAAATGITVTEATNRKTTYSFPTTVVGVHLIHLKSGSVVVWTGWTPASLVGSGSHEACSSLREALYLDSPVSEAGTPMGAGSVETAVTITTSGSSPVAECDVWVTSDESGETVVAGTLRTDVNGVVTFWLDPGDYWVWRQKAGVNFTNPQTLTVE